MLREMKSLKGQMEYLDRISELPEFILHLILSFLKTEEACRTSILSKQWYNAWASMPNLDFEPQYFENLYAANWYDEELVQIYVGYIDKTMRRYAEEKYFIRTFRLEFPSVDKNLAPFIDKWVGIAVQNKVEEIDLNISEVNSPDYRLPEIVFSAKSLKVLKSYNVVLPYYGTIKLHSLQCLELSNSTIDESILQRIVSISPLTDSKLEFCTGLKSISLPGLRSDLHDSYVKASSLINFNYWGKFSWPFNVDVGALKNLRRLEIFYAPVTDKFVSLLVSQLPSLDNLMLFACYMLRSIEISSKWLKKFTIVECDELEKATIDAPNLLSFWYNGQPELCLSIINPQVHCDSHLYVSVTSVSIKWFIALKEFLIKSNIFNALELDLTGCESQVSNSGHLVTSFHLYYTTIIILDHLIKSLGNFILGSGEG